MNKNNIFKVVIIEDNQQMSEMICDYLKEKVANSETSVFNTGESALEETKTAPDIFILDYNLDTNNPKALNGLQILMKIKKTFKDVPVIFLTGQDKPEVSANVIKYGAYDYIVKNQNAFGKLETIINTIKTQKPVSKSFISGKTTIVALVILVIILTILFFKKG